MYGTFELDPGVRLLRAGGLLGYSGGVFLRHRVGRIEDAALSGTGADGEHEARPVACPDDRVRDTGGTVEEIPLLERPLLALDDQEALALEHEEVLLRRLAVVHGHRLTRLHEIEVDPELGKALAVGLPVAELPEPAVDPFRVARVLHEPVHDAILEGVGDPAQSALPYDDDVEAKVEPAQLGVRKEPHLCGAANATLLLRRHHLGGIAPGDPALLLHLDEAQPPAAARDEIDLVASGPHVRTEDAPPAQPVPACCAALRSVSDSRALGTTVGARRTARARGRPPNARA